MTTVAVTGASGFVGGAVTRHLAARGFRVLAYGRRPPERVGRDLGVPYASWDVSRGPLPVAPSVDAVVHCAAAVDDWGMAGRVDRTNVAGTAAVLETWPDVRIVHMSSASVYDPYASHRDLVESDADPRDAVVIARVSWLGHYGRTKRLAEHLLATRRPDHVTLRPHAVYGSGDRTLLPRLLRRYRLGRLIVAGDPTSRISLTHIDNLVAAVERALACDAKGVYNVADPEPVALGPMLEEVLRAAGLRPRVLYLPMRLAWSFAAAAEVVHLRGLLPRPLVTRYQLSHFRGDFTLDTTRARVELGWSAVVDTREGIRRTFASGSSPAHHSAVAVA